jgi:ubiquinol-cytochrome c reductase iron-sulfur subunit
MAESAETPGATEETRRDFLYLATTAVGVVGIAAAAWPFIHSMNPAADVLALASTEVDLSPIEVGQGVVVKWRGKPVFIRHRSAEEISAAEADDGAEMRYPEPDSERVERPEWLILVGVCPHLGCVPLGQKPGDPKGDWGGWFCPCHGSHFDSSGRIRKGPSPANLPVPGYVFLDDTTIRIG